MARTVIHAAIGRGQRYDIDAILDDPRNWRGMKGQKEQAILRQIVRQSNGPGPDAPPQHIPPAINGLHPISIGKIEKYTGIKRETVVPVLEGLQTSGFIDFTIEEKGQRNAVYRAKLRDRNVENWPVKYRHVRGDLAARDCPF